MKPLRPSWAACASPLALANPHAAIVDWPMGGDEAGRALESVLCKLAASMVQGEKLTTDEILDALREADTLDDVLPHAVKDEKKALGWPLKRLRGRVFTDTRGRRFEFGKRDGANRVGYMVHFLDAATG